MEIILTGIIGVLTTVTSSWISWILARKKYNSEVDNNLIQNMQNSLIFYEKLSDDNKVRLEEVLKRNDDLDGEVRELRRQVFDMVHTICTDLSC